MIWPAEPCLLEGVSAAEYRADAFGDHPTLSRSIAHLGITASWLHAAASHPRLPGTTDRRESEEMDLGTLVHALLLGGLEGIDIHDVPDWRGKRADLRDASRAAGQVPIKLTDFEKAATASEILKPEICRQLARVAFPCPACGGDGCRACEHSGAEPARVPAWEDLGTELVCLWEEKVVGPLDCHINGRDFFHKSGVRCRARWDLYWPAAALIADPKVVTGGRYAQAAGFIRQLNTEADSGAMQAASYLRGHRAVHPELAGRETFVFLRLEPRPPYAVVPIRVDQSLLEVGERRWLRGVAGFGACLAANRWPGPGVAYARAETWAVERELAYSLEEDGDAEA